MSERSRSLWLTGIGVSFFALAGAAAAWVLLEGLSWMSVLWLLASQIGAGIVFVGVGGIVEARLLGKRVVRESIGAMAGVGLVLGGVLFVPHLLAAALKSWIGQLLPSSFLAWVVIH